MWKKPQNFAFEIFSGENPWVNFTVVSTLLEWESERTLRTEKVWVFGLANFQEPVVLFPFAERWAATMNVYFVINPSLGRSIIGPNWNWDAFGICFYFILFHFLYQGRKWFYKLHTKKQNKSYFWNN